MIEELYGKYRDCGYRVTTDSRAVKGGEMFFALKGENFDGNLYAGKALESGAAWAVVDSDAVPDDPRLIRVPDSFKALQELAIYHRENVAGGKRLPVLGLTGTNGKTTTKELIREVLATKYRVCATEGNLNNDIGVPLSLLKITPETEIAVIEMGANHPDDIAKLVRVSRPDCGLITNVGKAHLLGFGSFEGVKAAKGELYRWLASNGSGPVFLNADDADLSQMASSAGLGNICRYGLREQGAEVLPPDAACPFVRVRIGERTVNSNLVGAYNATNILAALRIGEYFGVPFEDAVRSIEGYVPANNRSQLVRSGSNTLIVDAYNANPSSMAAALSNFASFEADRKVALLGDMRELGADSVAEHVRILSLIPSGSEAFLVGEEFRKALDLSPISGARWFATSDDLAAFLEANPVSDSVILVKGSRGIMMEKALKALK